MIPKNLYQIWIGDKPLSDFHKQCQKSVKDLHPDWEHRLVTDESIIQHPEVQALRAPCELFYHKMLAKCSGTHCPEAFQSDLLKLLNLYVYGGFTLDTDMFCLKPLDKFLNDDFVLGAITGYDRPFQIGEHILGSAPRNPKVLEVIDQFCARTKDFKGNISMGLAFRAREKGWPWYTNDYFCPHRRDEPENKYRTTENTHFIHCWRDLEPYDVGVLKGLAAKAI